MPAAAPANAVIFYHPDGYDTARPRLMGRQAAGEGFLRAFVRHGGVPRLVCHAANEAIAKDFATRAKSYGAQAATGWVPLTRPEALAEIGCLYYPGPDINAQAWRRRGRHQRGYSLVGVTHTTASQAVMDAICGWFDAPLQPWDAVICTSRAVRDMVQRLLQAKGAYLRDRLGASKLVAPRLPIIPLGVDCEAFASDPVARRQWRDSLAIADGDLAVLYVGRLSLHGKAHPLAMYQALQRAAGQAPSGMKIHLIQAGWFANDTVAGVFRRGVTDHCPDVVCHFLEGRDAAVRAQIWKAADLFCSLSDNIQETFGLTPIEAMAAGLPVVVSDWDGYRDTVRDGIDGFCIPTTMPPPPYGSDLADRFAAGIDSYDRYTALTSQLIAVDVEAATAAFAALFQDAALRAKMGDAGRVRAREAYDWRHIIAHYQALWADLAEIRAKAEESAPLPRLSSEAGQPERPHPLAAAQANPARIDPFLAFQSYPTRMFQPDWRIARTATMCEGAAGRWMASPMAEFAVAALPPAQVMADFCALIDDTPRSIADLLAALPAPHRGACFRACGWLAKMGLVRLLPPA